MNLSDQYKRTYLLSIMLFISSLAFAQSNLKIAQDLPFNMEQSKAEKIDELVSQYTAYSKFNGTVLVAEKGKVIYKNGFGKANLEWNTPNKSDTKFRIASVTKQFTAMLVMQLVADGKLELDKPISNYLPDYPKENGDKINIHHLLTHTSGIPSYTNFPSYQDLMSEFREPTELLELFVDSTLLFAPGERFDYSNSGYALLGVLIEKSTGKSFAEVLDEKILEPLQMHNSGVDNRKLVLQNRAEGYDRNFDYFTKASYIDMSIAYTAGGIYSTVEDLFLWDQALYTEKLLPKKYMDMIFTKQTPAWGEHYGYGWFIGEMRMGNSDEIIPTITHDGYINGFNTIITRMPSEKSSIILLNNNGGAPIRRMAQAIYGILHDKDFDRPKQSIAIPMLSAIKANGVEAGIQFYNDNKDNQDFQINENDLNLAGYNLMQNDMIEKALEFFEFIVQTYPNSSNAYDSYAEALMKTGEREKAIKNYKKSLTLNPKNENAVDMLAKAGVKVNASDFYLLKTPDNWSKELFTFPLRFAQNIEYKGTEEAHFPRGWRNTESIEFWSYLFAWKVDASKAQTEDEIRKNLERYFDGLMLAVNKKKDFEIPASVATIKKSAKSDFDFSGTINIHDAFVTEEAMTLYLSVKQEYCPKEQKSIMVYRFSPKNFDSEIWDILDGMKLQEDFCKK